MTEVTTLNGAHAIAYARAETAKPGAPISHERDGDFLRLRAPLVIDLELVARVINKAGKAKDPISQTMTKPGKGPR